jgi:hypothetical protein
MTLTPSSSCMWVPLCSNRATRCFDTARERIGRRRLGCRRVILVENEHKLQLLRRRDVRNGCGRQRSS